MIIRLTCIIFCGLFATQCISTRNWMAENLLGVQIADGRDLFLTNAAGSAGRNSQHLECIIENDVRPVNSYPLTPQQRVEAMRKIRAAGVDQSNFGGVVYVPVSPSRSGGKRSERHYVRYDTKTATPREVVVLRD
jgi:hypothetical protein